MNFFAKWGTNMIFYKSLVKVRDQVGQFIEWITNSKRLTWNFIGVAQFCDLK